jgi:hypothetical protein
MLTGLMCAVATAWAVMSLFVLFAVVIERGHPDYQGNPVLVFNGWQWLLIALGLIVFTVCFFGLGTVVEPYWFYAGALVSPLAMLLFTRESKQVVK